MKRSLFCMSLVLLLLPGFVFFSCATNQVESLGQPEAALEPVPPVLLEPKVSSDDDGNMLGAISFPEVWAYLIAGNEEYLSFDYPITDLGYFEAEVDTYGNLVNIPEPSDIAGFTGRVHLVVVCNSTALTHFSLQPKGTVRKQLIDSLVAATEPFDGLQIDFELVPKRDGDTFFSFLAELRQRLPDKMLTIALPARIRTLENDVYDYAKIATVVDRILVMAYDEHWSTSAPGPIASLDWCDKIAAYSLDTIGVEKLIMGLPFYGRTWGNVSLNRAFYFSGIQRIMRENNVQIDDIKREDGIPTFTYEIPSVTVTGYYEDVHSLSIRLNRYKGAGVRAVGFWCLGQEDPRIWSYLGVSTE